MYQAALTSNRLRQSLAEMSRTRAEIGPLKEMAIAMRTEMLEGIKKLEAEILGELEREKVLAEGGECGRRASDAAEALLVHSLVSSVKQLAAPYDEDEVLAGNTPQIDLLGAWRVGSAAPDTMRGMNAGLALRRKQKVADAAAMVERQHTQRLIDVGYSWPGSPTAAEGDPERSLLRGEGLAGWQAIPAGQEHQTRHRRGDIREQLEKLTRAAMATESLRSIDEFPSLLGDDLLTEEIDTDHDFVCGEDPGNGEANTCDDRRLLQKEPWGEGKDVERLHRWAHGDGDLQRLSTAAMASERLRQNDVWERSDEQRQKESYSVFGQWRDHQALAGTLDDWGSAEEDRREQLENMTRAAVATESLRRIDQGDCGTADLWGVAVTLMASGENRHVSVPPCESGASDGDTSCSGEEVDILLNFASSLDYDKYLAEYDCQPVIASGNDGGCGHGLSQRTSTTPGASSTPMAKERGREGEIWRLQSLPSAFKDLSTDSTNPFSCRVYIAMVHDGGRMLCARRIVSVKKQTRAEARRFRRILSTAREARHVNVASVLGAIYSRKARGTPSLSILYELCDAGSLRDLLDNLARSKSRRADEGETVGMKSALHIVSEVAAGLAHLHGRLIIHRRLRPSKVLFSSTGAIKITDFGVPWREVAGTLETYACTPEHARYAAPEMLTCADTATPSADVWSLGVIALHLFTGQAPCQGLSYEDIKSNIARHGISLTFSKTPLVTRVQNRSLDVVVAKTAARSEFLLTSCLAFHPGERVSATKVIEICQDCGG